MLQSSQQAPSDQHRTTCSPNLQYYTEEMMQFVLARAGLLPSSIRQQRLQIAHLGPQTPSTGLRHPSFKEGAGKLYSVLSRLLSGQCGVLR